MFHPLIAARLKKTSPIVAGRWLRGMLLAALGAWACSTTAMEVVVGQVAPLTGNEAKQGRAYADGLRLAFDVANRSSSANGHTFKLVSIDDGGRPTETLAATRRLIDEQRPMVLSGYFGARSLAAVVGSGALESNALALVGYRTADTPKTHPLLFGVRAGLREEFNKFAMHLATIGWTRVGLLYEDGPGAADVIAASRASAEVAKVSLVAQVAYLPGSNTSMATAVEALLKVDPQAIVIVSSGSTAAAFIEKYRGEGGQAQIFAQSNTDVVQLVQRLGDEQMRGIVISQVTPSPYKVTTALSKELNDARRAHRPDVMPSFTLMEGYIAGRVIVEAVRRQTQPTRQGTIAALNSMTAYDMGGYSIAFSPSSHTGSTFVDLSIVSGLGKIQQ